MKLETLDFLKRKIRFVATMKKLSKSEQTNYYANNRNIIWKYVSGSNFYVNIFSFKEKLLLKKALPMLSA